MTNTGTRAGAWPAVAVAASLCLAFPLPAAAQAERALSVVWENDAFSRADQHYTNGLQFSWDGKGTPPAWAVRTVQRLPWVAADSNARHGYVFGQNMYTAIDIKLAEPPPDEPPYAAWLYGGMGLRLWNDVHSEHFSLLVGVIGPAALGEEAQKLVHKAVDATEPAGWDTQLGNEPGVVLAYQRSWRRVVRRLESGLESDLRPHAGVALGNVYTHANGGFTLRLGRRLPRDDGPFRVQRGGPGADFLPAEDYGWYFFAGVDGRAVARDIFLDGSTFRDSRSVDRKPLVADVQVGVTFAWHDLRLGYVHVLRTREYYGQPKLQDFGALTLTVPL